MNTRDVYQGVMRWWYAQGQTDASDGTVLLMGGLAAIGLLLIAIIWGLPT